MFLNINISFFVAFFYWLKIIYHYIKIECYNVEVWIRLNLLSPKSLIWLLLDWFSKKNVFWINTLWSFKSLRAIFFYCKYAKPLQIPFATHSLKCSNPDKLQQPPRECSISSRIDTLHYGNFTSTSFLENCLVFELQARSIGGGDDL